MYDGSSAYLQCMMGGPAQGGVAAADRRIKANDGRVKSGTPWSGQSV